MKKVLTLILAMVMLVSTVSGCTSLVKNADGTIDKGAIIDMYLATEVYNFDPQQSITDDSMLKIFSLMYEGLTRINEKGKWEKALMKNYEIVSDTDDEFSIIVELNSTCWSDGRTVQASDFVYSWKRLLDPDAKYEAASLLYDLKNAREIKMGDATIDDLGIASVDTYKLQIEFEKKVDLDRFFQNCSSIALVPLREDVITRYGIDKWATKSTYIVTNGPFCPKGIEHTNTLRLERSAYYYINKDKNEALDKYVTPYRLLTKYSTGDAEAQLEEFENNSIFYDGEIPLSKRAEYQNKVERTDLMSTHTYMFNINNELFANADVRRALSMALDRKAIADIVVYAKPATSYIPYKVYNTQNGTSFRTEGGDLISSSADVEAAKGLLSSAGVHGGAFTISVRNNEVDLAVADYVKSVWTDLGFDVTVDVVKAEPSDWEPDTYTDNFQKLYDSGDFDVIAIDMTMLSPDAFSALSQFAAKFSGNGVDMYSDTYDIYPHITGYVSADYDALIEEAYAAETAEARAEALHKAEEKLMEDMPVVPLVFLEDAYIKSGELSGIGTTYYGTRDFKKTKLKDYMTYKAATDTETTSAAAPETVG